MDCGFASEECCDGCSWTDRVAFPSSPAIHFPRHQDCNLYPLSSNHPSTNPPCPLRSLSLLVLGLALTKALPARTSLSVVSACRDPPIQTSVILDELDEADKLRICVLPLNVTDEESIWRAAANVQEQFGKKSLRFAFNNAGILHAEKALKQCEYEDVLLQTFRANALRPLFMVKHFVPLLAEGMMGKVAERIEEEGKLPTFGVFASISAWTAMQYFEPFRKSCKEIVTA